MIGTPGFVGQRLVEARQARGLTRTALAEILSLSPASISQYEHDKQSPSPAVLDQISNKLNRQRAYFLFPMRSRNRDGINFRSRSSATKAARGRAEARFSWLKDVVAYLTEHLEFPPVDMPEWRKVGDPNELTGKDIEIAAMELREHWKLGSSPIADLVLVLENHGVVVTRGLLEAETLDGFSQWDKGLAYVFLGADKGSAVRSRFDAAHEVGHLVLHRQVDERKRRNTSIHKLMEEQCHRFAGALLLPESTFLKELWRPSLDAFRILKPRWKVAIAAMIMRCHHLEQLSESQVTRAWINMSRRGWRRREPFDDTLTIEEPRLLRRSIQVLIESHLKSREQILLDLAETASDLEALTCLRPGFFSTQDDGFQPLPRLRQDSSPATNRRPAKVIRFSRER